jgi:hypothetical protein
MVEATHDARVEGETGLAGQQEAAVKKFHFLLVQLLGSKGAVVELSPARLTDWDQPVEAPLLESLHVDVEEELQFLKDNQFRV